MCPLTDTLRISAPPSCSAKILHDVLQTYSDTLSDQAAKLPPRQLFHTGAVLPLLGAELTLHHDSKARTHWHKKDEHFILTVGGQPEFFARRVREALRKRAQQELRSACNAAFTKAALTHTLRPIRRIGLSDTRGRWGSCASDGTLRFSWRLIFAPHWVLEYVAAHEVAHLAEMSHSPRFWNVVEAITPHAQSAKRWLQRYGSQIHRIGPVT